MNENPTEYPECDKFAAARPKADVISEFLEWAAHDQGIVLCRDDGHRGTSHSPYEPIRERPEELLAKFFGIDLAKLDQERREILSAVAEEAPR